MLIIRRITKHQYFIFAFSLVLSCGSLNAKTIYIYSRVESVQIQQLPDVESSVLKTIDKGTVLGVSCIGKSVRIQNTVGQWCMATPFDTEVERWQRGWVFSGLFRDLLADEEAWNIAVKKQDLPTLNKLLGYGYPNINKVPVVEFGSQSVSSLHMAVEFSNKSMVELLLSAGADPRLAMTLTDGKPGPSPYDLALALGDSSILELFNRKLGAGEKKPSKTDIPVSEAARDEKTVNSKEDFQDQGTHRAENNINGEHENEHSSASVENDDELNSIRWTWAVSFGDDLAVKRLLAQGISPNVVYWRRDSPNIMQEIEMEFSPPRSSDSYFEIYHHPALLLAVFDQNEKVVNVLLEAGADANCMDEEDYPSSQLVYGKCMVGPPLFIAVKKNNFNIAKMLIEHGAEVKDLYLPNLLQSIPAGEQNKWINLLVVAGNNFSSTQSSSYNLNCRAGLFCDGATSPLKPKFEKTPPAWTLLLNHETAEPMIEKGLNVNSEFNGPCWSGTSSGSTLVPLQIPWTPLMIAASNCDDRLVDLLRKNGAKENGKDLGDLICAERNGDFVKKISLKFKLRNVPKKAPYFDPSRCVVLDTDKFPSIGSKK